VARVPSIFMARKAVAHEKKKEKKDMVNRDGKRNWLVFVVIVLGLFGSLASAAGTDSPPVATEEKISVIPEPVTLLVLIAGLMLFSWKRTQKTRSRSAVTGTRD